MTNCTETTAFSSSSSFLTCRKNTFDMFNFLASQHRQLPESRPFDEDEDDVKLKCSRLGFFFFGACYLNIFCI